jgi:cytochrome c biogenesis protein CcmG/thiol:disulfide interchange protein DsbE
MPSPHRALLTALSLLAVLGGCGTQQPKNAAGSPAELRAAFRGAPEELKALYERRNQLVDGGPEAFKRQLAALKGHPVVVNKWASWCGPCRFEFPFFQRLARKYAGKVAFLGVDSRDVEEDARKFLEDFPVPYPSFGDPKGEIANVFRGDRTSPTTAFYDSHGELVLPKQGGYASRAALDADIRRYAR